MKKDHMEVLQREMLDELKTIHELVAGIRDTVNNQPTRDELNDLNREVQATKLAVTDMGHDLSEHKANERIHLMPSSGFERGHAAT